jgi:hypothetical protein
VVSLIGWVGVAVLAIGLVLGYRGGVPAAGVAFVLRDAVVAPLNVDLFPPVWAQVLLIVLMIEFASASFTLRSRRADPVLIVARGVMAALGASALAQILLALLEGAEATGTLVRVTGIAALVISAGWITRVWRRSGLPG